MEVSGELLDKAERARIRRGPHMDGGRKWDLHEMSLYIRKGHEAVEKNPEALEALRRGMSSFAAGDS